MWNQTAKKKEKLRFALSGAAYYETAAVELTLEIAKTKERPKQTAP